VCEVLEFVGEFVSRGYGTYELERESLSGETER
jgi:hypothetical protein